MKCIYHMHRQVELQHAAAVAPDKATKYKKTRGIIIIDILLYFVSGGPIIWMSGDGTSTFQVNAGQTEKKKAYNKEISLVLIWWWQLHYECYSFDILIEMFMWILLLKFY